MKDREILRRVAESSLDVERAVLDGEHACFSSDPVSRRFLHVQMVSRIARSIGRCLRLNEDLIEAIALGHDIGHTPCGHTGEAELARLLAKYGAGTFVHNAQSVRVR